MAEIDYKTLVSKKGDKPNGAPLETEYEILSIKNFIKQYHPGLTPEAVGYSIAQGKLDYTKPYQGRERFIVMTPHTKRYSPINHPSRNRIKS